MLPTCIDHLTITAPNLAIGAEFVRQTLGVLPQTGGAHPRMGTHNLLLGLGNAMFLEVIAPIPGAPRPARARWFDLDRLAADAPPRLSTWVARATDIHASAAAAGTVVALGAVEPMSRGNLDWLITIPADGSLVLDGVAPALIQWHTVQHPATTLEDAGCSLQKLVLFHPEPQRLSALLQSIELQGPVSVSPLPKGTAPYLLADIMTPTGLRQLSAP